MPDFGRSGGLKPELSTHSCTKLSAALVPVQRAIMSWFIAIARRDQQTLCGSADLEHRDRLRTSDIQRLLIDRGGGSRPLIPGPCAIRQPIIQESAQLVIVKHVLTQTKQHHCISRSRDAPFLRLLRKAGDTSTKALGSGGKFGD